MKSKSFGKWVRPLATLVMVVAAFPALARYQYVNGQGFANNYQAARAQAIGNASLFCGLSGGHTTSWMTIHVNQSNLGWWSVYVSGACFIPDRR